MSAVKTKAKMTKAEAVQVRSRYGKRIKIF